MIFDIHKALNFKQGKLLEMFKFSQKGPIFLYGFILFSILIISFYFSVSKYPPPLLFKFKREKCWYEYDLKKLENILLKAPIIKKIPIYEYEGFSKNLRQIFLETYRADPPLILYFNNNLKGIFKDRDDFELSHFISVQMYEFSKMLDLKIVPPTVIRHLNSKGKGVFQLFIDERNSEKEETLLRNLNLLEKSNFWLFTFIFSHDDISFTNTVIGKNCGIALIDNDSALLPFYTPYGEDTFEWNFFFNSKKMTVQDFRNLSKKKVNSFKYNTVSAAKNFLMNLDHSYKNHLFVEHILKDIGKSLEGRDLGQILYFFKDERSNLWIKNNYITDTIDMKDIVPKVFSKKTLRKVELLNRYKLRQSIENTVKKYNFDPKFLKENEKFIYTSISGILYRREVLLQEAENLKNKNMR